MSLGAPRGACVASYPRWAYDHCALYGKDSGYVVCIAYSKHAHQQHRPASRARIASRSKVNRNRQ